MRGSTSWEKDFPLIFNVIFLFMNALPLPVFDVDAKLCQNQVPEARLSGRHDCSGPQHARVSLEVTESLLTAAARDYGTQSWRARLVTEWFSADGRRCSSENDSCCRAAGPCVSPRSPGPEGGPGVIPEL